MRHIIILFLLNLLVINLLSQEKSDTTRINFINANRFFTTEKLGPQNKILVGEVALMHDSTTFYCDSAILNSEEKKIDAFGNIVIQRLYNYEDTIFIFGDTLHYDGKTKKLELRHNVKMIQDTTVLTTNFFDYDIKENIGTYYNGGRIISGEDTIESQTGYYYANTKDVYFKGNVKVLSKKAKIFTDTLKHNLDTRISYILGPSEIVNDSADIYAEFGRYDYNENLAYLSKHSKIVSGEHTIEADSLFFDRKKGFGEGFGNVKIIDTIQNLILTGNYGKFIRKNQYSMMTDSAMFMEIEDNDTLWLHGDTIESYVDTLFDFSDTIPFRILFAYHHVKIYKKDIQVKTDSLVYSQLDSVLMFFGSPILWSDQHQMTAQYMELKIADNNPQEMMMYDSCYIAQQIDSTDFNIVKGSEVQVWFRKKEVYKVAVKENVNVVYFLQDDKDSSKIGVCNMNSDSMYIYMNDNKIKLLIPYSNPEGTIYPPDEVPPDKETIPGFEWFEIYRPLKPEDIFVWKRESQN